MTKLWAVKVKDEYVNMVSIVSRGGIHYATGPSHGRPILFDSEHRAFHLAQLLDGMTEAWEDSA